MPPNPAVDKYPKRLKDREARLAQFEVARQSLDTYEPAVEFRYLVALACNRLEALEGSGKHSTASVSASTTNQESALGEQAPSSSAAKYSAAHPLGRFDAFVIS